MLGIPPKPREGYVASSINLAYTQSGCFRLLHISQIPIVVERETSSSMNLEK